MDDKPKTAAELEAMAAAMPSLRDELLKKAASVKAAETAAANDAAAKAAAKVTPADAYRKVAVVPATPAERTIEDHEFDSLTMDAIEDRCKHNPALLASYQRHNPTNFRLKLAEQMKRRFGVMA